MTATITLAVGATAEPDTCGSCKFFQRKDDWRAGFGDCRIKLPRKFAEQWQIRKLTPKPKDYEYEYTGNEDQIKDTDRCDLHRPDGNVYIVQRLVGKL